MKRSAALLMYRFGAAGVELLLVHPGGPFWRKKDQGAWSIPKGEYAEGEDPLRAARREFLEETGFVAEGEFLELGAIRQPGGKLITAWAFEGECDADAVKSNTFSLEWPPGSGRLAEFPEVDRAGWFTPEASREKILKGQAGFIDGLLALLRRRHPEG